jgi:hypothetical protein
VNQDKEEHMATDSNSVSDLARRFAEAFNQRNLQDMAALLADDATAEVLGSGFGIETGRSMITQTSLQHILDDKRAPLQAEAREIAGDTFVLLLRKSDRSLDVATRLQTANNRICRLEYLVTHFRREEMIRLMEPLKIEVSEPD